MFTVTCYVLCSSGLAVSSWGKCSQSLLRRTQKEETDASGLEVDDRNIPWQGYVQNCSLIQNVVHCVSATEYYINFASSKRLKPRDWNSVKVIKRAVSLYPACVSWWRRHMNERIHFPMLNILCNGNKRMVQIHSMPKYLGTGSRHQTNCKIIDNHITQWLQNLAYHREQQKVWISRGIVLLILVDPTQHIVVHPILILTGPTSTRDTCKWIKQSKAKRNSRFIPIRQAKWGERQVSKGSTEAKSLIKVNIIAQTRSKFRQWQTIKSTI